MAAKSRKKASVKRQDTSFGAGIAYIALGVFFLLPESLAVNARVVAAIAMLMAT